MLRRILVLLLAIAASACDAGPSEDGVDPDRREVRMAVVRFLDALAGGDRGRPLPGTVGGPQLQDWAAAVEDVGARSGTVDLRSIRVGSIEGNVARVQLDATVTIARDGAAAPPEEELTLLGPVVLVRDRAGTWLVTDFLREGRPMSLAVTVFHPPVRGDAGGVEVEVRSLYRFVTGTMANLRIRNASGASVRVDRPPTRIQAAGRFVGATTAAAPILAEIGPGDSPEGSVDFHPVPLRWLPEKVMVQLESGALVTVDLPVEAFVPAPTEA